MVAEFVRYRPIALGATHGTLGILGVGAVLLPFQARLAAPVEALALLVPILLAGILGGRFAALVTSLLGAFVLAMVLPPYWAPTIGSRSDRLVVLGYVLAGACVGAAIAALADGSRRAALTERAMLLAPGPVISFARGGGSTAPAPASTLVEPSVVSARPLGAFLGHHKCGTSWIGAVICDLCDQLGWSYVGTDHGGPFAEEGMQQWAVHHRVDMLILTNSDARLLPPPSAMRAFHVIRDQRDMCVSAYFSHRNSHPTDHWQRLEGMRSHLRGVDRDDGLAYEIEFLGPIFAAMEAWDYERPDILELRFEDLTDRPQELFGQIARFLSMTSDADGDSGSGGPRTGDVRVMGEKVRRRLYLPPATRLTDGDVRRVVDVHSFEAKTGGRARGVVDVESHYRSGLAGDWANHFSPDHVALFEAKYPSLIERLGYPPST